MDRIILHSDLNNFYASVECLYNPAIRNKPVAVAGDIEKRHGIILAKNYIAKAYGIKTGDALWQARDKCPDIVFVPPSYDKYLNYSKMAREIYSDYTNQVESFGLDECWLDISNSTELFGDGERVANEIRQRIKDELGVTASVGVSYNKIFAKLGSDMKKPDATTVITKDNFKEKVWVLPASDLLYVGRATTAKLKKLSVHTIGDLAQIEPKYLKQELGINGIMLWQFANGLDQSLVSEIYSSPTIKSIGNSTTLPYDVSKEEDLKVTLYVLCESVAERLRRDGFLASTVQIWLRDKCLFSYERQGKLSFPSCSSEDLFNKAFEIYKANKPIAALRSVGVRACNLSTNVERQLSCLNEFDETIKREKLENTIDDIRRRFGHFSIQRASMLTNPILSSLDPVTDHIIHPVGFLK
jgi:DNA polymerase-4